MSIHAGSAGAAGDDARGISGAEQDIMCSICLEVTRDAGQLYLACPAFTEECVRSGDAQPCAQSAESPRTRRWWSRSASSARTFSAVPASCRPNPALASEDGTGCIQYHPDAAAVRLSSRAPR
jgi:hypothetical protein